MSRTHHRAHRAFRASLVAISVAALVAACGSGHGASSAKKPSESARGALVVVGLGDSDATGVGDPSGAGWVARYGRLLQDDLGRHVTVDNLAAAGQTSAELRDAVLRDDFVRHLIGTAGVVLIGIGGADLNAGDDALAGGSCAGRACYAGILKTFGANISTIATEVHRLAPHALLRAMSLPNGFPGAGKAFPPFATAGISKYQVDAERTSVCQAMRAAGGECVDVVQAFNGNNGDRDAYAAGLMTKDPCCYPSAQGQELIAKLLIASRSPAAP